MTCPFCHKKSYEDKKSARTAANVLEKKGKAKRLWEYPCEHGNGYHITKQPH